MKTNENFYDWLYFCGYKIFWIIKLYELCEWKTVANVCCLRLNVFNELVSGKIKEIYGYYSY